MPKTSKIYSPQGWLLVIPLAVFISACNTESKDPETYLRSAQVLAEKRDFRGAEIELRNAVRVAPDNINVRLQLAQLYLNSNNPAAAEAQLITARQRGASEETLDALLAQALYSQGKMDDVLRDLRPGNRPPKTESVVRTYRGLAELGLGNPERAEALFDEAARLDQTATGPKIAKAQILMYSGQMDAAEALNGEVLKVDPKSDRALEQRARILAARGNTEGALQSFDAAIKENQFSVQAYLGKASLKLASGDLDGALIDVKAAQRVAQGSGLAALIEAEIAVRKGDFKSADAILTGLRPIMDRLPQAYYLAGVAKYQLQQLDQAGDFLNRYVARLAGNPQAGNPHAYALLAAIALRRGDADRAVVSAEQAARLAPDDPTIKSILSQAYFAKGETERSVLVLSEAVAKQPDNALLRTELAVSRLRTGDSGAAISELTTVFDAGAGSVDAGPPLVAAALSSGHTDDAAATAEALVRKDPNNTLYQGLLGSVRMAQRDFSGAEKIFAALLAKEPDLTSARDNLAEVYWATDRKAMAKKLFEDRLRAAETEVPSLQSLAQLLGREGAYDEARRLLIRAQQAATEDPTPGIQLAALYAEQKNWPEAVKQVRTMSSAFPRDARVVDVTGRVLLSSGDMTGGVAAYRQGTEMFPDSAAMRTNYAAALFRARDDGAALAALEIAVDLDPRNQGLKVQLVEQTYRVKGGNAALAVVRAKTSAGDPLGAVLAAEILDRDGMYADALALLQRTQAEKGSQPVVLKLVELRRRHNEVAPAIAVLEAWLKDHPDDVSPRITLGQIYGTQSNFRAAITHFEHVAAERSSDPAVLNDLAWNYQKVKDLRARSTAEKAYRLAPQVPHIADTLGWILTEEGDAAGGSKYLQVAAAALPDVPEVQYHYAVALSRTNRVAEARNVLQKIVAPNVQFDGLVAARQLLERLSPATRP